MPEFQYPWDLSEIDPAPAGGFSERLGEGTLPDGLAPPKKKRGRRPAAVVPAIALTQPDWLYHHLTVSGPVAAVAGFAAAARGSGIIPWQLDYAALEEDIFVQAVAQPPVRRSLTVAGCRILARQFCQRVKAHQAHAAARVGASRACPLDLHALLPVPPGVLGLGPRHPEALAWLQTHWGITDRLRQVVVRPEATTARRRPAGHAVIGYGFFTDGETPHAAIRQSGTTWPEVRFVLQPRPPG
jgi:hypothetical protein